MMPCYHLTETSTPRRDTRVRVRLKLVASAVHQVLLAVSRRRDHGPWMFVVFVLDRRRGTNGSTDALNALLSGVTLTAETGMLSHIDVDAAGRTLRPRLALPKRRKHKMLPYRLSHHRLYLLLCQMRPC